ncbi:MAG: hypothetical protein R3C03_01805 [Pirellulaceae bacterium]
MGLKEQFFFRDWIQSIQAASQINRYSIVHVMPAAIVSGLSERNVKLQGFSMCMTAGFVRHDLSKAIAWLRRRIEFNYVFAI